MLTEDHVEKVRFEVSFPEKDHGASASIHMHISVLRFFKTLTGEQIKNIRKDLVSVGEQYFGEQAKLECNVMIDTEYGLGSWNCPGGYACDFGPSEGEWEHMRDEDREWIKYTPHNTDRPEQLMYLLAAACYFRDLAEAASE